MSQSKKVLRDVNRLRKTLLRSYFEPPSEVRESTLRIVINTIQKRAKEYPTMFAQWDEKEKNLAGL